ncbi:MAG: type I pullulanase [Ruminococcus sp.]|nr:type I pullulanase [Ruminococcus sp.]
MEISNSYYDGDLGAVWSAESTSFSVWSPFAEWIKLRIYDDCTTETPVQEITMENEDGVWKATVDGDLSGKYYTYVVCICGNTRETIDIYAKSAGVNGKRGYIFDPKSTDPEGWQDSKPVKLEKYTDAVIYEVHVRDFSSDPNSGFVHKGKFAAFTETGVTNRLEETIGLDYVADLGVTHIHLLPVFDFATSDEASENPQYNWGYDPLNYNVPEGSYSLDPYDGKCRVKEFKELVLAAHKRNIGVIMDVVYNHTYMWENSAFTAIYPDYYYRQNYGGGYSNGSGCGNELASERSMVRRYIIDSLCWWAKEYKLDGFRFDLMGLLDVETLNLAAQKLREINPSIILYGEGWTGGGSALDESQRAMKYNARKVPEYAMFSDDFRDCVKGSVFQERGCGFVNGDTSEQRFDQVRTNFCGGNSGWTDTPAQSVNYVEAHDNLTLHDKLRVSMTHANESDILNAEKLSAALVFLSRGIPFMQAGQEFMRRKPLPQGGFEHNSYNSPDSINNIRWDDLSRFRPLADYYKGLIAIRKKFEVFRRADRSGISFGRLHNGALTIEMGEFMLVINPYYADVYFDITGDVYADKYRAADKPLYKVSGITKCGVRSILLVKRT